MSNLLDLFMLPYLSRIFLVATSFSISISIDTGRVGFFGDNRSGSYGSYFKHGAVPLHEKLEPYS